ncbi:PIN-like domain-containing protein [Actinomadura violacea]|uniref:DUF4935 domain-containing protein n=1 Tax=Actinomadura violacea TaxID=2819934 RepID=A0ABS3RX11_9ACTN|nr:PIN-like domain-containing protein [Actinomadura violacea]MBO2461181.1 DUF4935 domain-containing protein [Actinomadura violacea]
MTDEASDDGAQTADASSLRGLFPWHFGPPAGAELERFLTQGLVVFDTNALFDAYRLNPQGREEFLRTLDLLGNQLWVPHRVAEEFMKNRLGVISECAGAVGKLAQELKGSFNKIKDELDNFRGRRGLEKALVDDLVKQLGEVQQQIVEKIGEYYRFDLKAADCLAEDPILSEIEKLLEGRIGPPVKNMQQVREDAAYRYARRIPPGYADAEKPPEQAIGDYVLWVQLLQEVERLPRPVLFVTNEKKKAEDWAVKQPGGRSPLPRPELSAEVWQRAGQPFHIVDVRSFLELANEFLDAHVSDETITQAEEMGDEAEEEAEVSSPLEEQLAFVLAEEEGHQVIRLPSFDFVEAANRQVRQIGTSAAFERALQRHLNSRTAVERALQKHLDSRAAVERAVQRQLDSRAAAERAVQRQLDATEAIERGLGRLGKLNQGRPAEQPDSTLEHAEEESEPPEDEPQ